MELGEEAHPGLDMHASVVVSILALAQMVRYTEQEIVQEPLQGFQDHCSRPVA